MKYTIKVVTKIFLKVPALPLLENLIEEKQRNCRNSRDKDLVCSAKDLLVLFPHHQKSNSFLKEHDKADPEKEVRGFSARSRL